MDHLDSIDINWTHQKSKTLWIIGDNGGNIYIKAENIDMYYHKLNKPHTDGNNVCSNIICSIGIDNKYGVGGNVMIECNNLNLSKQQNTFDSRIASIGKFKNGQVIIKANIIKGDIANLKPNYNLTNNANPSTIILY